MWTQLICYMCVEIGYIIIGMNRSLSGRGMLSVLLYVYCVCWFIMAVYVSVGCAHRANKYQLCG